MHRSSRRAFLSMAILGVIPIFISHRAISQNTFPTTGNVGIGTTSPGTLLEVSGASGATQTNIAKFSNSTNNAYTSISSAGNSSIVGTWTDGSQIMEFVPYNAGDGIIDTYTGNLQFQTRRTNQMTITTGGNVGIGTANPGYKLDIAGQANAIGYCISGSCITSWPTTSSNTWTGAQTFSGDSGSTQTNIVTFNNSSNGAYTSMTSAGSASIVGTWTDGSQIMEFVPYGSGNGIIDAYTGNLFFQTSRNNRMVITSAGNVGIGTASPQYLLSVSGTIQAKEVLVNTGWADYVFQPGYRIRPLTEVAAFIEANHHLPDIPSETEIKDKGVSLGEMQTKLLAKIEELTLQMIQLDEKNKALAKKVAQLEGR